MTAPAIDRKTAPDGAVFPYRGGADEVAGLCLDTSWGAEVQAFQPASTRM